MSHCFISFSEEEVSLRARSARSASLVSVAFLLGSVSMRRLVCSSRAWRQPAIAFSDGYFFVFKFFGCFFEEGCDFNFEFLP